MFAHLKIKQLIYTSSVLFALITPSIVYGDTISANTDELERYIEGKTSTLSKKFDAEYVWRQPLSDFITIKNEENQKEFKAGSFSRVSLNELRSMQVPSKGGGTFNIIISGDGTWDHVNIMKLQADPANTYALFQIASNFNALEGVNGEWREITQYCEDRTQGPFAALSAAPGTYARHNFIFPSVKKPFETGRGQEKQLQWESLEATKKKQVVLFEDKHISYKNGYLKFEAGKQGEILKHLKNLSSKDDFFIGYQRNVQVTFSDLDFNEKLLTIHDDPTQIISQAFMSALFIGWNETPENDKELEIAKYIMKYAYEATLRLAVCEQHQTVYLTLLGGGAFNNPPEWIIESLTELIPFIKKSGLTVILNGATTIPNLSQELQQQYKNMVAQTGGTITTFYKDTTAVVEKPKMTETEVKKTEPIQQPVSEEEMHKQLETFAQALAALKQ